MKLKVIGEAPSRRGDGRPFSGASGARLAKLMGLPDYEAMWRHPDLYLDNLFPAPVPKEKSGRGDTFDRKLARYNALFLTRRLEEQDDTGPIIACGHRVYRALAGERGILFKGRRIAPFDIWLMPHPSGTSPFWNDPANHAQAARFLERIQKRYGFTITE